MEQQARKTNSTRFDSWLPGDRYQLNRVLGKGSYGEVGEATDSKTGRKVAIKRMQSIFDEITDAKRVYREMHILRHLDHPNVISILDVICPNFDSSTPSVFSFQSDDKASSKRLRGRSDGDTKDADSNRLNDLYIVFDFVDTDLYKLILSAQYLSTAHIKCFLYQMLIGLKYIHSANVVHRDIKPANILVNEDCSLKICDFGLSRVIGREHLSGVTRSDSSESRGDPSESNSSVGADVKSPPKPLKRQLTRHVVTRWYRAPELVLLQEYGTAVDVWSAGCIFAELLGMQAENVKNYRDRVALFPGKSCYPLSDDHMDNEDKTSMFIEHNKDQVDQLSVIFDVIGSPSDKDIEEIESPNIRNFLRKVEKQDPVDFKEMYPGADPNAIDLLRLMLQFSPRNRVTVEQTLNHPFFQDVRNVSVETVAIMPMSVDIETHGESPENLKSNVLAELECYSMRR